MQNELQTERLMQTVGSDLKNKNGEFIGHITEVKRDEKDGTAHYIILKSDQFFGRGDRVFAIPAASKFIKMDETGTIIYKTSIDDLQFATGVAVEKCPAPDGGISAKIYELYKYKVPEGPKSRKSAKPKEIN